MCVIEAENDTKSCSVLLCQVMLNREDLVVSVQNPDGSLSVEHADGTRITTFFQNKPASTPQHIMLYTGDQQTVDTHNSQHLAYRGTQLSYNQSRATLSVSFPGDRPDSVTLKSSCDCVCGCAECVCVTRCADSINENMHVRDTCEPESGEEIGRDSAETAFNGEDDSGRACAKLIESEHMCDEQERADSSAHRNFEECVFAEETVTESVKMNACESEKGSVSVKERVLVVEKEGCATVVMYPERRMAHVFLADGTVITGNNHGDYQVSC